MDQTLLEPATSAAAALARGDLVGLPTETVYGLGADATNAEAVAKIFAAKGRPHFNPLISHVASLEAAEALGVFSPLARKLADAFWPGPLSLVVARQPDCVVCDLACAGLDTIALRVPAHPLMQDVLRAFGKPVAAPSANVSGRPSPTTADHVREEFGDKLALVLDGGPSAVGLESAVVAVSGDQATLLRLGGLSREALEAVAGPLLSPDASAKAAPASPGMVLRHYAPRAPLRLNALSAEAGEVMIGFGPGYKGAEFNLSPSGDLTEAAAQLFAMLRAADALNPTAIVITAIPETGLGEAIADRLARAAERSC
ncbi:MAG: L-threonylcarbamoyladenylate synthase [Hyphomonadaceae bacterium]|jgi:L-threonylcarbamoyladenylate synthase|uniref:L-threonylcarbamoyladenylate synthase n=1 Tax=Aquidulcibacter sp. TaxID=2052990 RepID=UPI0022C2A4DF|nr:L-threonylcarbamoyladenylate synthase [Aquidulcibacter sp.]MCE2890545.1 threonylcarbamoyl-AMP synthase [Hyphomonadaceae bacterium]MCZ8207980.1 L-threonylcarbamoyladenylate synthase [Aquidulcibacter sp.]